MVDPSTACKNLPAGFDASQLPKRGDVGMLYCGPPCQGFSGMNQNRTNEDHKNALILTALSYVEVLRPAVFLLENVTGMLGFRLGAVRRAKGKVETGGYTMGVPRLIVRVLLDLGYQVGWSVLQVGAFGSCQSRRRVIFVATLPHVKLPVFPEPMYLFRTDSVKMATYDPALRSADDESVDIESDQDPLSATPAHWRHDQEPNQGWNSPMTFVSSRWALFPPRFISDAISDFPGFDFKYPADNEAIMQLTPAEKEALRYDSSLPVVDAVKFQKSQIRTIRPEKPEERKYLSLPKTEFQWQMRRNNRTHRGDWDALVSHPWYSISADVDGGHVEEEGEVPDFVCRSFKAVTVERIHHIARDARSHHRDHRDLPELLKPWALDVTKNATAAKHGGWKGLYGRMDWWGFSRTATTETDPMCKTGTILHPEQNRTVTVREMARIQTFPDDFVFDTDKIMVAEAYRQVGNAVPPALATAINRELFKSLRASPLGHLSEAKAREAMGVPPLDDPRT
ncbi:S-adenosyl-L-methionine-dependent methyltransferase [Blastocladiella britannica]|nr:S-adenosyl-L-methionine-dependent methyltransferase [Blastocladiella britannica]